MLLQLTYHRFLTQSSPELQDCFLLSRSELKILSRYSSILLKYQVFWSLVPVFDKANLPNLGTFIIQKFRTQNFFHLSASLNPFIEASARLVLFVLECFLGNFSCPLSAPVSYLSGTAQSVLNSDLPQLSNLRLSVTTTYMSFIEIAINFWNLYKKVCLKILVFWFLLWISDSPKLRNIFLFFIDSSWCSNVHSRNNSCKSFHHGFKQKTFL